MTRPRLLRPAAAAAAVVLLVGCGASSQDAADDAPATPTTSDATEPDAAPAPQGAVEPESSEGPGVDPGGASDLAEAAEELAGEQPTPGSIAPRDAPVLGADISWPQCPKGMGIKERPTEGMPMPVAEAEFVVVGLTNGPAFTPNPCLADQVQWASGRQLMLAAYSVLSYPDAGQLDQHGDTGPYDADKRLGRLRNVGYAQASYNLANMRDAGLVTPIVWIDVEPVTIWEWSGDKAANVAVVEGAVRGYRDAGMPVGVYSTHYLWQEIVGTFELGVPEWRTAGSAGRDEALRRCGEDSAIQGGQAVLTQWVADRRDHNLTCNGSERDLGRWFTAP